MGRRYVRAAGWALFAVGSGAPLVRRRLRRGRYLAQALAYGAPIGLYLGMDRSPRRPVAVCASHMWAYLSAYELPNDRPQELRRRVRLRYPLAADRLLAGGRVPTVVLQRRLAGRAPALEAVLVWAHWLWFLVPHAALAWILRRAPDRLPGAAARTYAVFDAGALFYWTVPTAPPWYAGQLARAGEAELPGEVAAVRRLMVEYGERFWGKRWEPLFKLLGGNPLAAMPSLHLATSLAAALELREVDRRAYRLAAAYTATLAFALVYLGEHYVVDLLGGVVLAVAVRRLAQPATPLALAASRALAELGEAGREAYTSESKVIPWKEARWQTVQSSR